MVDLERFRGCLLGLAVGDALGAAVEFSPRGTFPPITDMIGGGPFGLKPGQWTDDTSLALCLAASLVEQQRFDPDDIMSRFVRWWREGYMSCTGSCFDIGTTTSGALRRYTLTGEPFAGSEAPGQAGNGCIMRLAPVPMFYFPKIDEAEYYAAQSSRLTHGAQECVDCARLLARIVCRALAGKDRDEVLFADATSFQGAPSVVAIARGQYTKKSEQQIEGSGYVVRCLEAALWCFYHAGDYREAVLRAVNLGDDTDTTAAVCGQVAGAFWSMKGIPQSWLDRLAMRELIVSLADQLAQHAQRNLTDAPDPTEGNES